MQNNKCCFSSFIYFGNDIDTPLISYMTSFLALSLTPAEHNESLKCERLKSQKDRRRPDSCHPFHPEENAMECGGALGLAPQMAGILLPLLFSLLAR
ncbi:hypothetical protein ANANG_G00224310 [Anguilla anguilla]|uniref:Uncharacterized protein n=1 Tax=Anguilla anguilla TaxID=7936 RepID=A0A9D3RPV3_ANGAN|nr:hypothetical protein ANANG_G00224310 [Anguilla anguilla]